MTDTYNKIIISLQSNSIIMRKIIFKIWQAIKSWIQKQEELYEKDYIKAICKRYHKQFPECKFICFRSYSNPLIFYLLPEFKYRDLTSSKNFLNKESKLLCSIYPKYQLITKYVISYSKLHHELVYIIE